MPLSFRPACRPVSFGSLPHSGVAQAIALLRELTPDVLAWPELPRRSFRDRGYVQSALGFPGLVVENLAERVYVNQAAVDQGLDRLTLAYLEGDTARAALPLEEQAVWADMLRAVNLGLGCSVLKLSLFGPVSLSLQLTDEQMRPLAYETVLLDAVVHHLSLRVGWMTAQLSAATSELVICLDETLLASFSSPFCPLNWEQGTAMIEQVFAALRGCRGLAVSANINWAPLLRTSVEFIQLNAYDYGEALLEAALELGAFLHRGGVVAWGVVPTDERALAQMGAPEAAARFTMLIDRLVALGLPRETLVQAALISTGGGLHQLSIEAAERALRLCAETAALLRRQYGLDEGATR